MAKKGCFEVSYMDCGTNVEAPLDNLRLGDNLKVVAVVS